ncbi:MAG: DUF2894 domain-containing protein [Gammaproteobacteria bacterium]|nr:DUF2894 domain-containing protein [Gammaproteobacteria bacterium]
MTPERKSMRQRHADALLQRAQQQRPALRARLEARAQALLASATTGGRPACVAPTAPEPSGLALLMALREELAAHASNVGEGGAEPGIVGQLQMQDLTLLAVPSGMPARRELRAAQSVRVAKARRHSAQRIAQALAQSPADAGPLNSHRLVIRSLNTLQSISPDYLNRFVGYVDTLMALEQAAARL